MHHRAIPISPTLRPARPIYLSSASQPSVNQESWAESRKGRQMIRRCFRLRLLSFRAEVFVRDLQQPYVAHNPTIKPRFLARSDKVVAGSNRIGIDHSCCSSAPHLTLVCLHLMKCHGSVSKWLPDLACVELKIDKASFPPTDLDDSGPITGAKNATIVGPVTSMVDVFWAERSAANPNNKHSAVEVYVVRSIISVVHSQC